MGYCTDFEIHTEPPLTDVDFELHDELSSGDAVLMGNGVVQIHAKWYKWKEDLCRLSLSFYPTTLFTVYGQGENNDDIWVAYIKGGIVLYHQAEIVYPPYNPDAGEIK